jgi:DNA-binding GntR family transcriptional regulator
MLDHRKIIQALEQRTELAEQFTRQHTRDLAARVERYCKQLLD